MNSKSDDPDNHVPPVSPEDNWGDLDESTERSRIGLPPRRVEGGLPSKKESPADKITLRMPADDEGEEVFPMGVAATDEGDEEAENGVETREEDPPVKRDKPARKYGDHRSPIKRQAALPDLNVDIVQVPAKSAPNKKVRVNEIKPGGEKAAARPAERVAPVVTQVQILEPEDESEGEAQKHRRFTRGERADWGTKATKGSMRWMLLTGLGVIALVILAVVMNQSPKAGEKGNREESVYSTMAPAENEPPVSDGDADANYRLINSREEAETIFSAYATAESAEDFIGFVYRPDSNKGIIEKEWKPLGMQEDWMPGSGANWYTQEENGIHHAVLEGLLSDFTSFRAYFREEGGELKLDWKATVGYGSADFAELKTGNADGSEVRCWLSPADFHTFSFPESEFSSYRIVSPVRTETIWGYVPLGGELDTKLKALFRPSQISGEAKIEVPAKLRLNASGGESLPEQWLIGEIERFDWLDE